MMEQTYESVSFRDYAADQKDLYAQLASVTAERDESISKGQKLCATLGNLGVHIRELGLVSTGDMGQWLFKNDRAEKAEAERDELRKQLRDMALVIEDHINGARSARLREALAEWKQAHPEEK